MPQTSLPFPAIYGAFVGWGNIPWLLNIDGSLDCTIKLRKGIGNLWIKKTSEDKRQALYLRDRLKQRFL